MGSLRPGHSLTLCECGLDSARGLEPFDPMKGTILLEQLLHIWLNYAESGCEVQIHGCECHLALAAISSGEKTGTVPLGCNRGEVTRSNRLPRVSANSELSKVNTRSLE